MKVTALMPMRHSSERVPGKNYRTFNDKPLFHHVLEALLAVNNVDRVVINTDSGIIIDQCETLFPEVHCIKRPTELLGGDVPMTEILQHDAQLFPSEWFLQTHSTNPLLSAVTIASAIKALEESLDAFDSLFSVNRLQTRLYGSDHQPLNHDPSILLRTQDLPPIFEENSNIYLFSADQIAGGQRFGSNPVLFELDPLESVDIDEEHDFVLAETLQRLRAER